MAQYNRAEIIEKTGIPSATLRSEIKRGKLDEVNGFIDTETLKNKAWILEKIEKYRGSDSKIKNDVSEPATKSLIDSVVDDDDILFDTSGFVTKESLQKEKLIEEIESLKLKNAKLKAELIPVELVKPLFMQFSKSLTTAYQNELESILIEIGHKHKMSQSDKAYFKGRVIEAVNIANSEGVEDVKKNLVHIADQFAEVRTQGESK